MTQKRSFKVDTTSLATAAPVIEAGIYAGKIINASVKIKDNWTINIVKEQEWDDKIKKFVDKVGGDYIISGNLNYGVVLTSKKAIKTLQRDEPKFFGGRIALSYDKENFTLLDNHVLGHLLTVTGLNEVDFDAEVDFEWNDDIEVPEELASVPNIVTMLNGLAYTRSLFSKIAETLNLINVKVKVIQRPVKSNKELIENAIDIGTSFAPFCGFLPYEEGFENDLEEA